MQSIADKLAKSTEGLKQFGRRAKEKALQSLGVHSASTDPAFDSRLSRIQRLDEQLQVVHSAVSDYLAASTAAQKAAVQLGRAFEDVVVEQEMNEGSSEQSRHMRGILAEYVERNKKIQAWMKDSIEATCTETVVRPVGEKLRAMPALLAKVQHRQQMVLDFDSFKSRLDAERSKNPDSDASSKLACKVENADRSLRLASEDVLEACDIVEEGKEELLISCFASLVACQAMIHEQNGESIGPLIKSLPQSAVALCMICTKSEGVINSNK